MSRPGPFWSEDPPDSYLCPDCGAEVEVGYVSECPYCGHDPKDEREPLDPEDRDPYDWWPE
jgi:rubredoxin